MGKVVAVGVIYYVINCDEVKGYQKEETFTFSCFMSLKATGGFPTVAQRIYMKKRWYDDGYSFHAFIQS